MCQASPKIHIFFTSNVDKDRHSQQYFRRQLIHLCSICLQLTFIEYFKASVGPAVIGGKQQVKEIAGAEQKLGHLGAIEGTNQRR